MLYFMIIKEKEVKPMKRRKLSKRASKRIFKRGAKVKSMNNKRNMRGGIRL